MLTAILLLTIFNTGLIFLIGCGGIAALKQAAIEIAAKATRHIDDSISAATTAVFNMDSLKQKAKMSDEVEV